MAQYQIVFDGKTYSFTGPLPFGQFKIVEPSIARVEDMLDSFKKTSIPLDGKFYDEISTLIVTVIGGVDKTFTREVFEKIPVTRNDLLAAYKEIMFSTGAWVPKAASEGEGKTASPNPQSP